MDPVTALIGLVAAAAGGGLAHQGLEWVAKKREARRARPRRYLRDVVGLGLFVVGALLLWLSYVEWAWGTGRREWWVAFHLEIGGALVIVGAVETLLMSRVSESDSATQRSSVGRAGESRSPERDDR